MNNKKLVLGILLVTSIIFSCKQKKKSDNNPSVEKKTEVVTKKQYPKKYFKTYDTYNYSITFESDNA